MKPRTRRLTTASRNHRSRCQQTWLLIANLLPIKCTSKCLFALLDSDFDYLLPGMSQDYLSAKYSHKHRRTGTRYCNTCCGQALIFTDSKCKLTLSRLKTTLVFSSMLWNYASAQAAPRHKAERIRPRPLVARKHQHVALGNRDKRALWVSSPPRSHQSTSRHGDWLDLEENMGHRIRNSRNHKSGSEK